MKIVLLDGALANQMTQYIFARCLEEELKETGEEVYLDDLWFYAQHDSVCKQIEKIEKHHYQLDKFPNLKKMKLMSEYFETEVWQRIIELANEKGAVRAGTRLPQILKDNGLEFFMIAEPKVYEFDGMVAHMPYYHYMPEMLTAQGNVYYFGWFTHGGWFKRHEEMFLKELQLSPLSSPQDIAMQQQILDSYSISVHIRRGGYALVGCATKEEYFNSTLKQICTQIEENKWYGKKKPCIYVFSDEINWCKEHAKELGLADAPFQVVYCRDDRTELDNHCDMQLMSKCDVMILEATSVYSYMAALLNTKPNKIVINPNKGRGVF